MKKTKSRTAKRIAASKLAFLRTVEAVIAIGLMFIFLAAMTPVPQSSVNRDVIHSLSVLEHDNAFRNCVLSDADCVYDYVDPFIPDKYAYNITISSDPNYMLDSLPKDKYISSDSVLIAGNSTFYNATVVRVYYWVR